MKKSRLYTRDEDIRFVGVIFLVIILLSNGIHIYIRGLDIISIKIAMISMGILLFFELLHFPFWYIPEKKKQKAIKYGEVYTGKYYDIKTVYQSVISIHQRRSCYEVQIEVDLDGEKQIVCRDLYYDNPGYYIVKNQECKVYKYKGKFYPEIIYYDSKTKAEYIFENYEHEDELFIPSVEFEYGNLNIYVRMTTKVILNKSESKYNMNVEEQVCKFLESVCRERIIENYDKEVTYGVEDIVRNEIIKMDSSIQIKNINVLVYTLKKNKI